MGEIDDRFVHLQLLNTPERIERIDAFSIRIKVTTLEGELQPYIEMSEAIVTDTGKLSVTARSIARFIFGLDVDDYIDPDFVQDKIEKKIKRMLLYGGFLFEDEADDYEFLMDDEIASLEGDELSILKKVDN